jgi:hypothetical protein
MGRSHAYRHESRQGVPDARSHGVLAGAGGARAPARSHRDGPEGVGRQFGELSASSWAADFQITLRAVGGPYGWRLRCQQASYKELPRLPQRATDLMSARSQDRCRCSANASRGMGAPLLHSMQAGSSRPVSINSLMAPYAAANGISEATDVGSP